MQGKKLKKLDKYATKIEYKDIFKYLYNKGQRGKRLLRMCLQIIEKIIQLQIRRLQIQVYSRKQIDYK